MNCLFLTRCLETVGVGDNVQEDASAAPFICPRGFDRTVMVMVLAQWYDLPSRDAARGDGFKPCQCLSLRLAAVMPV